MLSGKQLKYLAMWRLVLITISTLGYMIIVDAGGENWKYFQKRNYLLFIRNRIWEDVLITPMSEYPIQKTEAVWLVILVSLSKKAIRRMISKMLLNYVVWNKL